MNIIEFSNYKRYCPFCKSEMQLFASFAFSANNHISYRFQNVSYKYNGKNFIKVPSDKSYYSDFDEKKLINTFSINKLIFHSLVVNNLKKNLFSIMNYVLISKIFL